jgi:2-hydroxychromene-2-carboxylate isomerase
MEASMRQIDFFFFFGSGYAYLSVLRIQRLAESANVKVRWRPFNVRPLMQENNVALRSEARKVKYMWRDIERRAAAHGLPFLRPPVWPTDPDLLHNKVGALAAAEGWGQAFAEASFKAWYLENMALGEAVCLEHVIAKLGKNTAEVIDRAKGPKGSMLYDENTEDARRHGIFGSPSFVTQDGEMFWGDDRLDEAISWAANEHPLQRKI